MTLLSLAVFALILLPCPIWADGPVSFVRDVAPILRENCFACHNVQKHKGEFRMTSYRLLMQGGDRGVAVVPGKPEESNLYTLVAGVDNPRMPPKEAGEPLAAEKVRVIERWIKEGAKFDGASPEGDMLAELRKTWTPPQPPERYPKPVAVRSLAFSPDGKRLVVAGYHELLVYDWQTGTLEERLWTRSERASAMVFVDGETLAVAGGRPGQEGDVCLYHVRAGMHKPVQRMDGTKIGDVLQRYLLQVDDEVLCLALSPDGKQLAAGGTDRLVRIWDLKGNLAKPARIIENHSDWVLSVVFTADGKQLVTTSRDKTAKVWDLERRTSIFAFPDHQAPVQGAASKGDLLISGGDDGQLRVWRAAPGSKQVRAVGGFKKAITRVALRPSTSQVIATAADGTVRVINLERGNVVEQLNGLTDWVYALAVSSDGKYAAAGAWNGEVRVWSLETGKVAKAFVASPGKVVVR